MKQRIVKHELAPGQLLHELELMDTVGFGRTPIREAIQRLAAEKLVVARPRQTAFVAPILASDMSELVEMRLILECPAARLAATRGTARGRAKLREAGEAFRAHVKAMDIEGSLAADAAIHTMIAVMACNSAGSNESAFWIAVETPITERRPHRTVRAAFPHTAPTLGV